MPIQRRNLSEFAGMWVFAMFDLPVGTKNARRAYTRFRKLLLSFGFSQLQFSIYARYYPSQDASVSHRLCIKEHLPAHGQVRLLMVTDHQFGKMEIFFGKTKVQTEKPPEQLLLF